MRFVLFLLTLLVFRAAAQDVAAPVEGPVANEPAAEPAALESETNPLVVPEESDPVLQIFQWGAFDFRPHASYQGVYDDNIYLRNNNRQADFIHTLSPGIFIGGGDYRNTNKSGAFLPGGAYLMFNYTPGFLFFTKNDVNDTIDQRVNFEVGRVFDRISLDLSHNFEITSEPLIEGGGRSSRTVNTTRGTSTYLVTGRVTWDAEINQQLADYETRVSTKNWSTLQYANYFFTPKLDLGLGGGFGYTEVERYPDSVYEQGQLRVRYRPTDKLTAVLNGGTEFRQFHGGNAADDLARPIFGLRVAYQPTGATLGSLGISKEVRASNIFGNQVSDGILFDLYMRQRFIQKIYVALGLGYGMVNYENTERNLKLDSDYNYFFVNPSVAYRLRKYLSFRVFDRFLSVEATGSIQKFTDNQIGFSIDLVF